MILTQSGTSGTANVPPGLKLKTVTSVSMGGNEKEMRQSSGVDGQPWDTRHMLMTCNAVFSSCHVSSNK